MTQMRRRRRSANASRAAADASSLAGVDLTRQAVIEDRQAAVADDEHIIGIGVGIDRAEPR